MRSVYIKKSRYSAIPALNTIPKVQKEPNLDLPLFCFYLLLRFCQNYGKIRHIRMTYTGKV